MFLRDFTTMSSKIDLEKIGLLLCKKTRGKKHLPLRNDSKYVQIAVLSHWRKVQGLKKVYDQSNGAFHDRLELDNEDAN